MNRRFFLVLFVLFYVFFFNFNIFAQTYYADLDIYVKADGKVSMSGITNYEPYQNIINSQIFTSKDLDYWILNISTDEVFDSYFFKLYLPKGANANYIKTTKNIKFDEENGRKIIIGKDINKPLRLLVQYKIGEIIDNNNQPQTQLISNQMLILILTGFFFLFTILIIMIYFNLRVKHIINTKNKDEKVDLYESKKIEEKEEYDYSILSERQQDIINILKEKNKITQKELETIMQIPKSSVSRNIRTLEIKGIVKKEQVGQTNYISLK